MSGWDRRRRRALARTAAVWVALAGLGAIAGLCVGIATPARVEIAGSNTRVWIEPGRAYDQVGIDGLLSGRRATPRTVAGEPIGVRAVIDLDTEQITSGSGRFDVNLLPAYIQAYSDPSQLVHDIAHALAVHLVLSTVLGALIAVALYLIWLAYHVWRRRYDSRHFPNRDARRLARAYRAPERTFARFTALAVIGLVVLGAIPSSGPAAQPAQPIVGDAIFAGTPLAGIQVDGLLRPAFVAIESYIETYFDRTNRYYDELTTKLDTFLAEHAVMLPGSTSATQTTTQRATDDDVVQLGFVTDRHCNIGMDRVIVALLDHFHVGTLVSAGDDAFSGSFGFESACTKNLADKTQQAGIDDIFVGGNHDSPTTLQDETEQGITVLDGDILEHDGLQFVGSADPRTSRYGQGLVPSTTQAQDRLLTRQGNAAAKLACDATGGVIVVMHGPLAGATAMRHGCGHVTIALDGHLHKQVGPTEISEPDGRIGYQFVGASSGGAPGEEVTDTSLASQLTVGPLHHDATVNIVSVRRTTGELLGVTEFRFTPDQTISVEQQRI